MNAGEEPSAGPPSATHQEKVGQSLARPPAGARWRMRVGVAWISALLLAYYLVHPPLSASFLTTLLTPAHQLALDWQIPARLAGHLLDLLIAFWLLVLAAALGLLLWRLCRLPAAEDMLRVALGSGLGLGALGLASFALGIAGWLSSWGGWAGLLLLSVLCARDGWWLARWLSSQAHQMRLAIRAGSWLDRLLWGYILLTLLLMGLAALLPPTAWDALMYHLAVPAVDHARGLVLPDPANPQGYQPELVEMLYLDTLLLRGDGSAALIHLGFGLLSLLLLIALARRIADRAHSATMALRAVAIFLSIPSFVLVLGWPYIDGALVYYELAALCALLCWWNGQRHQHPGWLLLSGILLGLALDTKYTAAFAIGALGLLVLWHAWRADGARRALWQVTLLVGVALLVGSPWLLRNLLLMGDPIFPYHLGHLFPAGPLWDDGRSQQMTEGPGWGWGQVWRLLTLPLEVTLYGTQGSVEFDATLGPVLLLLLPLGLLAGSRIRGHSNPLNVSDTANSSDPPASSARSDLSDLSDPTWHWPERQVIGVLLAFAAFQMLCWDIELFSVHVARQSRLFFPLFAVLALPAAVAWMRLKRPPLLLPGLYRLASGAVVVALVCGLLGQMAGVLGNGNAPYLLGVQSRQSYLIDHLDPYYAAMSAVNALPGAAHVLFLWEVRSYYASASRMVQPDPFLDTFNYYYRYCPTAEALARCFHQAGFTHLLLYAQGLQLVLDGRPGDETSQELAALSAFLAHYARPVYQDSVPIVREAPGNASLGVQVVGERGWYRLYALTGP